MHRYEHRFLYFKNLTYLNSSTFHLEKLFEFSVRRTKEGCRLARTTSRKDFNFSNERHMGFSSLMPKWRRSKLYIACSDFFEKNQSSLMPPLLLFRKKARSAQLLTCKRVRDVSLSLPPFCEYACGANISTVRISRLVAIRIVFSEFRL